MRAMFDFIVKPIGKRYDNIKKVDDKELILNTKIESFKSVNNMAEVVNIPLAFKTDIKVGDKIIIHHNVFRRFYDIRGDQKNSRSFLKEDLYLVQQDQIYLYGDIGKWKTFGDRCFVKPIKNNDQFSLEKEQKHIGILKYGNSSLEELGINKGDLVGFKPYSEFEFIIDDSRLYCMKSNDIVIKYEYKGDETEYNPSWQKSS
jgi:co-chaperonin GroES (HSP10)